MCSVFLLIKCLQRKPYRTIQDEILFAKYHKGNCVGQCGVIILITRDNSVPMWCSMLKNDVVKIAVLII